jgi:hypothetical protein
MRRESASLLCRWEDQRPTPERIPAEPTLLPLEIKRADGQEDGGAFIDNPEEIRKKDRIYKRDYRARKKLEAESQKPKEEEDGSSQFS